MDNVTIDIIKVTIDLMKNIPSHCNATRVLIPCYVTSQNDHLEIVYCKALLKYMREIYLPILLWITSFFYRVFHQFASPQNFLKIVVKKHQQNKKEKREEKEILFLK